MIKDIVNVLKSEVKHEVSGSILKRVEDAIREKVIVVVTVIHPDPTINEMAIPCDSCPYLKRNGACDYKCDSWYPFLAERLVYNSLPESDKLRAELKLLKKKCKDLGEA